MEVRRMSMNMTYGMVVQQRRLEYDFGRKKEKMVSKSKSYFSVESVLVLVGLAVSLLVLPVVLPPLPPPPPMLLLLPVVILGGLVVFAVVPSSWSSTARRKKVV